MWAECSKVCRPVGHGSVSTLGTMTLCYGSQVRACTRRERRRIGTPLILPVSRRVRCSRYGSSGSRARTSTRLSTAHSIGFELGPPGLLNKCGSDWASERVIMSQTRHGSADRGCRGVREASLFRSEWIELWQKGALFPFAFGMYTRRTTGAW